MSWHFCSGHCDMSRAASFDSVSEGRNFQKRTFYKGRVTDAGHLSRLRGRLKVKKPTNHPTQQTNNPTGIVNPNWSQVQLQEPRGLVRAVSLPGSGSVCSQEISQIVSVEIGNGTGGEFQYRHPVLGVLEAARKGAAGCFLNKQSSTLARQWAFSVWHRQAALGGDTGI